MVTNHEVKREWVTGLTSISFTNHAISGLVENYEANWVCQGILRVSYELEEAKLKPRQPFRPFQKGLVLKQSTIYELLNRQYLR